MKRATPGIPAGSTPDKRDRGTVMTGSSSERQVVDARFTGNASMTNIANNPANESIMDPPRRWNVSG